MADIIDEAHEREEELREKALAARKPEGPPACGFCYFCDEPLGKGQRWCDADCRDDWEKAMRARENQESRYDDDPS
jgi:hypothetical protein